MRGTEWFTPWCLPSSPYPVEKPEVGGTEASWTSGRGPLRPQQAPPERAVPLPHHGRGARTLSCGVECRSKHHHRRGIHRSPLSEIGSIFPGSSSHLELWGTPSGRLPPGRQYRTALPASFYGHPNALINSRTCAPEASNVSGPAGPARSPGDSGAAGKSGWLTATGLIYAAFPWFQPLVVSSLPYSLYPKPLL